MLEPNKETNVPMPLAKLIDLNGIQKMPQLAAAIKRRISAEANLLAQKEESDRVLEDRIVFLEETVCELVDLLASMEMETEERRRFKRITR